MAGASRAVVVAHRRRPPREVVAFYLSKVSARRHELALPPGTRLLVIPETEAAAAALRADRRFNTRIPVHLSHRAPEPPPFLAADGAAPDRDAPGRDAPGRDAAIAAAAADLAAAGGTLAGVQVRARLRVCSRTLRRRVAAGELLAVPGANRDRRFPAIQFDPFGGMLPGLAPLRALLDPLGPWAVLAFLVRPNPRLHDARPVDLLRAGAAARVLNAARHPDPIPDPIPDPLRA